MVTMTEPSEKLPASLPSGLRFESYGIDHLVDASGHHHLPLDPEFPFAINAFSDETLKPDVNHSFIGKTPEARPTPPAIWRSKTLEFIDAMIGKKTK